jgi:phage-related protein (TIGR01555 family)
MFDTFANFLSGLGVIGRDKLTGSQYVAPVWSREQLETAFRTDWIARKAIAIPAHDATREWRLWQAEQDQIEKLEATEKRLQVQLKLQQALTKARLYGGCCLLIGVDGNPEKELDPETIKADGLKFLHVLAPHQLTIDDLIKDIEDPYYGQPEFYILRDETEKFGDAKIHPSRMVRLIGLDSPDPMSNFGWGDPMMQMIHDAVNAAGTVSGSIATMITEAKLDVIKIPGLTEIFSTDSGTNRILKRFSEANVAKSVVNGILMDAEEEWQRIGVDFTGMPEILQMYLQIAAGAADIPVTRFLGRSPAGLNATGDSDLVNYYDRIASDQELRLTPALEKLDKAIQRSALGKFDENIFYDWKPLWQMDEAQKSEIAKRKADSAMVDVNSGLIPFEALAKGRGNQLIEDGTYPGLESALEEAIANQEMLAEQGLGPDGLPLDQGMGVQPPDEEGGGQPPRGGGNGSRMPSWMSADSAGVAGKGDIPFGMRLKILLLKQLREQLGVQLGNAAFRDWDESQHPRDPGGPGGGRFVVGGGGSGGSSKSKSAGRVRGRREDVTQTPEFKKWFGDSKVVDDNGDPKVVYHGTTVNFQSFSKEKASPEGNWGAGFYFTDNPTDVSVNYAGMGPDMKSRVERTKERLESEENLSEDEAKKRALEKHVEHEGVTIPVYLRIETPFEIGNDEGEANTYLDMDTHFDEEKDEYGEPTGKLVDFVAALKDVAGEYHEGEVDDVVGKIMEEGIDGGISAVKLDKIIRDDEMFGYYSDDNGDLVSTEIFRQALERVGFDGVIDRTVSARFMGMKELKKDTAHYIVFDPTSIKSAIGNVGTFDPKKENILQTGTPVEPKLEPDEIMTPAELKRFNELEETYKNHTPEEAAEYKALSEKFEKRFQRQNEIFIEKNEAEYQAGRTKVLREQADAVAKDLDFDASRIDFVAGTREFDVNGVKHTAAGDANIALGDEGRIRIYSEHVTTGASKGVVAHEIEHFKFQHALDAYKKEEQAMIADPGPAPDPVHPHYWGQRGGGYAVVKPSGGLRAPYDTKYPIYTAMSAARFEPDLKKFANGDGVSAYSAEYWKAWKNGKISTDLAFHETLAEMARIKYETGKFPEHFGYSALISERIKAAPGTPEYIEKHPDKAEGTKLWRDLYRTVERVYKERKK